MKSLYYYNPISFIHSIYRKDVTAWGSIYKLINEAVGMNDRSGLLKLPIHLKMYKQCLMPEYKIFTESYNDCVQKKVTELYNLSEKLQKPIGILYSGGIDSTGVIVGFLSRYHINDLKDKIKIIMNSHSIYENPEFFKNFLLPNFELINSHQLPVLFDGSMILVTGEFNDQIFGSDIINRYLIKRGTQEIKDKFNKDTVFEFINSYIQHDNISKLLIDKISQSALLKNINLEKNSDFFWWYNFCYKWQTVNFRIYTLASPKLIPNITKEWAQEHIHHFYQTDDFQLWSMNHPEVRIIDNWKQYKQESKKVIYDFDKNEDYFIHKYKRPSLQHIFYHRLISYAITDELKILTDFKPFDYYNPDNDFVDL